LHPWTTSWIHGDFVAGNVLVDSVTRAVSGIVDWELAASPHLPARDLAKLVLSAPDPRAPPRVR
jgi:aminoglycoside phosphotransferase (APT) family kinase protein